MKGLLNAQHSFYNYSGLNSTEKIVTLAAGLNGNGDFDGTGNPSTIFTVTGTVVMKLYAICTTDVVGASATLSVGVLGTTAGLIALTTGTNIDVGEIWHDATPDSGVENDTVAPEKIVNSDVILTVGTANATGGVIKFICLWKPVTINGNVVAA